MLEEIKNDTLKETDKAEKISPIIEHDEEENGIKREFNSDSLKVVKMLYEKMTEEEKDRFNKEALNIYIKENNTGINAYTMRAFQQEDVRFYYIKKAIENTY